MHNKRKELTPDLVCFSHLRWDFVFQRPQHLLSRFAKCFRVFYVEEPHYHAEKDHYTAVLSKENVWVVTPYLKEDYTNADDVHARQRVLLNELFAEENINEYIFWYYTPMALNVSSHFNPKVVVYDCMDELSAFKSAPPSLKILEKNLFAKADVVFTGGHNLYEAKKNSHYNIHPFPSSIDKEHFGQARKSSEEPADQKNIPYPRLGFYGVLDERFDINLIEEVAKRKPDWQMVLIGPVVKIHPDSLPKLANIHYLGGKQYKELPQYLAGWDIALVPFAKNESTKYISPTKTPEYLAGGKPVISTSIRDVVVPYGEKNLVHIADTADAFIAAAEQELSKQNKTFWLQEVDEFLSQNSWDITWYKMYQLVQQQLLSKQNILKTSKTEEAYV